VKRNRRRSMRGAELVELALALIPALVVLVGAIDVSLVIFIQSTLQQACREGARFAITFSSSYNGTSCATSQATCIEQVVQNNAYGFLAGSKINYVSVNYYTANSLTTAVETCSQSIPGCTQNGTLPQTLSNGTIVSYVNQPGNVVQVAVTNYPWNWLLPLSATGYQLTTSSINLNASSVDVLGALAVGTTIPPNP
jgi:Flp pilus assembly protein TadG